MDDIFPPWMLTKARCKYQGNESLSSLIFCFPLSLLVIDMMLWVWEGLQLSCQNCALHRPSRPLRSCSNRRNWNFWVDAFDAGRETFSFQIVFVLVYAYEFWWVCMSSSECWKIKFNMQKTSSTLDYHIVRMNKRKRAALLFIFTIWVDIYRVPRSSNIQAASNSSTTCSAHFQGNMKRVMVSWVWWLISLICT